MAQETPVVVVGSGRLARAVASRLGHPHSAAVTVLECVDHDWGAERSPSEDATPNRTVYHPDTLRAVGVGPDTQLVVLTDNDHVNFLVATIAQQVLGVTSTLVSTSDASRGGLWDEFKIEALNPTELAADAILSRIRR